MKIIDGYNVIGAAGDFGLALAQPDKEDRFLRLLASFRARRRSRESMLVVFDGHYGRLAGGPRRYSHAGIDVEWAIGETADALILRRVKGAPHPQDLEVVTSDALILRNIVTWGAQGTRSQEFLAQVGRTLGERPEEEKPAAESPAEIAAWLERFGDEKPGR